MPRNSPYQSAFDNMIQGLVDSGILDYMTKRYLFKGNSKSTKGVLAQELGLEELQGSFWFIAFGVILTSGILVAECLSQL